MRILHTTLADAGCSRRWIAFNLMMYRAAAGFTKDIYPPCHELQEAGSTRRFVSMNRSILPDDVARKRSKSGACKDREIIKRAPVGEATRGKRVPVHDVLPQSWDSCLVWRHARCPGIGRAHNVAQSQSRETSHCREMLRQAGRYWAGRTSSQACGRGVRRRTNHASAPNGALDTQMKEELVQSLHGSPRGLHA
jgi:hypothetical protein